MSTEHVVKCWCVYFEAIERGDKTFDVRRDDRGYQCGDVLVLEKYNPQTHTYEADYTNMEHGSLGKTKTLRRTITYVLTGGQFGIEPGYVVLAIPPHTPTSETDAP